MQQRKEEHQPPEPASEAEPPNPSIAPEPDKQRHGGTRQDSGPRNVIDPGRKERGRDEEYQRCCRNGKVCPPAAERQTECRLLEQRRQEEHDPERKAPCSLPDAVPGGIPGMNQHVGEVVEEGQRQVDGQKPEEALQDAGCPQVELAILPGRQNEAHHIPQFAALPV